MPRGLSDSVSIRRKAPAAPLFRPKGPPMFQAESHFFSFFFPTLHDKQWLSSGISKLYEARWEWERARQGWHRASDTTWIYFTKITPPLPFLRDLPQGVLNTCLKDAVCVENISGNKAGFPKSYWKTMRLVTRNLENSFREQLVYRINEKKCINVYKNI